jgi:RNA polymerase sigma-70 factor (ECF subfamily)
MDESPRDLARERQHLVNLAFRMFGSTAEAEAVVQQTYTLWYAMSESERDAFAVPRAWLTRTAARICLDILASRRGVRDGYVGEWLPEPVPNTSVGHATPPADPLDRITLDESVSMALLVLLDSLAPEERVAFVLHDVFGVSFDAIGDIVGRTTRESRTLASNARRNIHRLRTHETTPEAHTTVARAFGQAWELGDATTLAALLAPDVVALTDGGGKVTAEAQPIRGVAQVVRLVLHAFDGPGDVEITTQPVNGQTGLVIRRGLSVVGVVSFNISDSLVTDVWMVLNPDKLERWNRG